MTVTDDSPLADRAARGIRKSDWVKTDGANRYVTTRAFMRDPRDRPRPERGDDMVELSIDYLDDESVLGRLLRRKDTAPHGAAVFRPDQAASLAMRPENRAQYRFERREEAGNVHHGHLLLHVDLPAPVELFIASALAMYAEVHTL